MGFGILPGLLVLVKNMFETLHAFPLVNFEE
jgi:hypothetical protein